jgi:hypothetical protein
MEEQPCGPGAPDTSVSFELGRGLDLPALPGREGEH